MCSGLHFRAVVCGVSFVFSTEGFDFKKEDLRTIQYKARISNVQVRPELPSLEFCTKSVQVLIKVQGNQMDQHAWKQPEFVFLTFLRSAYKKTHPIDLHLMLFYLELNLKLKMRKIELLKPSLRLLAMWTNHLCLKSETRFQILGGGGGLVSDMFDRS